MYVLIGILLLGILVAVHEFGHFIAARATGIEVMEFAIGMGPKIVGWTGKSGTKFSLRCIPLGGFCAFYGEDDVEGKSKDDPRAYSKQNVWKRIFTVAMGPMMNFVLALVVAIAVYAFMAVPVYEPVITEIVAESPAAQAGLQPGDVITAVDGVNVLDGTTTALSAAIGNILGAGVDFNKHLFVAGTAGSPGTPAIVGIAGDFSDAVYGVVEDITVEFSREATLVNGNTTINLWQNNMVACKVEATLAFAVKSAAEFVLLTGDTPSA